MATAINDFIQGIIMLFGICAVIGAVLVDNGGLANATKNLSAITGDAGWQGAYSSFLGPDPLGTFICSSSYIPWNMGTSTNGRKILCH